MVFCPEVVYVDVMRRCCCFAEQTIAAHGAVPRAYIPDVNERAVPSVRG